MKVLLIASEKLPVPPVRGGATQTYIDAVAPLLAAKDAVTVMGIADPQLPDTETQHGVDYVRVPGGRFDRYMHAVTRYLRENSFDLIHIFNRPRLVLPVRATAPNARIILSMHNDMFNPEKITPTEAQQVIAQSERIVTVSDYVGRVLIDLYPMAQDKVQTIYAGVDLNRFHPWNSLLALPVRQALRQQYDLQNRQVILFVGRLSPKKGADVLVRALTPLAERHPDAALALVGSKWYGEDHVSDYVAYVRALAARAPLPVISTGFVPQDRIHEWFWASDLFACCSLWQEPLARVHYEAMAAGLPIVTTARGGNPEVIRGNGMVVEQPDEPYHMATALSLLLSDPKLRQEWGQRGRSLAEKRYSWQRVAADILDIWHPRSFHA